MNDPEKSRQIIDFFIEHKLTFNNEQVFNILRSDKIPFDSKCKLLEYLGKTNFLLKGHLKRYLSKIFGHNVLTNQNYLLDNFDEKKHTLKSISESQSKVLATQDDFQPDEFKYSVWS